MENQLKVPYQVGETYKGKVIAAIHNRCAEGEVTGHAHRVLTNAGYVLEFADGSRELVMVEEGAITHEEHGPVTLPLGNYEVRIVQEVSPLDDMVQKVLD